MPYSSSAVSRSHLFRHSSTRQPFSAAMAAMRSMRYGSVTGMAALAMMVFLWTWNNYLDALVFLPNWRLYTIPLALTSFIEESTTQYHLMMAAASSAIVPVVIVFIIGNKQFVKGITAGAVKG